ncbi:DNA methyltransferase [Candidatus Poriferisocius sp.]|uniref:DNA methyltransferase n=1 Tax=Candidatus Poriferisocius sp. TaxID=3101276 RepID=UPI003B01221E
MFLIDHHGRPVAITGGAFRPSKTGRTCEYEYDGVVYHCGATRHWRVSTPQEQRHSNGTARASGESGAPDGAPEQDSGLDRLKELGRLEGTGPTGSLHWKWYEDEVPGRRIDNVWHRLQNPSNKRYAVQTANSVIERCILMSTDPGDLVLDPTCGSGATAHMAEQWGRRWITIDAGRVSIAIARRHLLTTVHPWYRTTDESADPSAGFQVETMQRVSAATLAYDRVDDPENTISLVDRPRVDTKRRRLTGPFTVESHSPYTWLPFDTDNADAGNPGTASGDDAERLLDALVDSPICDSNGDTVLEIAEITAYPGGGMVTHEADCTSPGRQTRITAAVMLSAPDATVTADQITAAASQARRGNNTITNLIVVAPAFDDNAPHQAGPIAVHKVVTARDLQISGLAPDADSGAFTLLGEPDVLCETTESGDLVVSLLGYDTYDPATGNVKTSGGEDVDCWMIDTNHDRTAFFPRLVYLPAYKRGNPNIKNLLKALGKDLDPQAQTTLCGLESQPFPPPPPPNVIAIKIITRTGAEMTTTLELPPA